MSDPIFQRGLLDLIKGIRSHKKDGSTYISQAITEIKAELRSTDAFIKAEAVRKLTYLQMTGYNVSWASFAIVEVMSQSRFAHKRIGYLAANQSFDDNTDVLLLTTNLFKKEFTSITSNNQYEIGLAINSLANIANKDLARDCISDLVNLMNHSKPYIRKKAVLAMYKLYVKFPQGLRLTFDKLKDRLEDTESSVVSTAVNVICELANKNPKNYLTMAPKFFRLLTSSSNNWMLIKVVKLLGSLVSEEPRLARKLLEPMSTIIKSTGAKSLQFECIYTITEALPHSKRDDGSDAKNVAVVIKLCSDYLRGFIEDNDQNLKYLGLVGLVNLMKSNARSVVEHRDLVLKCLNDEDITIRTKALELLAGIVSKKSLVDLVQHLLEHARRSEGAYRDELIAKIMYMCRKEKYALVSSFSWYTATLLELAVMQGSKHGAEVAEQLMEVSLRVDTVRPYAVEKMIAMLMDDKLALGQARTTVCEVLKAAAWIVGEYSDVITMIACDDAPDDDDDEESNAYWIENASEEDIRSEYRGQNVHLLLVGALLHPRATNLPPHVQVVFVQSAMKLFLRAVVDLEEENVAEILGTVRTRLPVFMQNQNLEVQERASTFRFLLSEFDILPLNWEEAAEEASRNKIEDDVENDLLDLPAFNAVSVEEVDHQGAKIACEKKTVLQTAIAEAFYAVHSKAQRRVAIPEGLSLDDALDSSALDELLAVEIPTNLSLQTLFFVAVPSYPTITALSGGNGDRDEDWGRGDKNLHNAFGDRSYGNGAFGNTTSFEDQQQGSGVYPSRTSASSEVYSGRMSQADSVFMLGGSSGSKASQDLMPLSKILGENFEEISGGGDKKKKKSRKDKTAVEEEEKPRKHKSRSKTAKSEVLVTIGGESSDEETPRADKKKKGRKTKNGSDDEGLDTVDLSTPLRADEVFSVQKHRVVASSVPVPSVVHPVTAASSSTTEHDEKEEKKKKKSSSRDKDKSKDSVASSSSHHHHHHNEGNLLDDFSSFAPAPVVASVSVSSVAPNTVDATSNEHTHKSSSKSKHKDKDREKESSKKSSGKDSKGDKPHKSFHKSSSGTKEEGKKKSSKSSRGEEGDTDLLDMGFETLN